MLRFIAHFSKQRVLCSRTFPTKWNLCEIYCQKKHVQNIQWSFIPHVAFYRLPEWNGDYENATKCDIKCAVKIIILNKKHICTAYSKISKSHSPTDQLWGTRLHISYGRNKWQFQGNLLAYGALQNRCQPMGHKFILVGTEIHSMPDGCTTACHQSCKKKNQQRFCFLVQCTFRGAVFSLSLGYLFFLPSFFFLHIWAALLEERAMAWPVVFRWSKSLFLVANSYWQVTQRRLTSFYKEQNKKKSYINVICYKFAD